MKLQSRHLFALIIACAITVATAQGVLAAKKAPDASPVPSAGASASAAPLPTATPEAPEIAIPRLEAKIKANPQDKDALQELAGFYLQTGQADRALACTQRLLSLGVTTAQVYYLDGIANQSLSQPNIKNALSDFENATNKEPTNAQILLTLTNLYLNLNRASDAERVAKRATTFNSTDKRVFENYGLVLGQEGKYDDARTQFEAAAKLDPKDPVPVVLEARSYVSQHAFALAAQDFDRALGIDPKFPDALLGKASLQAQGHQVKDAMATYDQLLAIEPTDDAKASVIVQEYQVYRDEKMNDDAVAVLKKGLETYPNAAALHIALGDYDVAIAKDKNAAETEWKTALGAKRDNPEALQRLAELSMANNKCNDSVDYLKQLVTVSGDPRAYLELANAQGQCKQFSDARGSYQKAFELQRSPAALAGLGSVDLQLKNYRECQQVFGAIERGAIDTFKNQPQLLYAYGKCAQNNNDKDTARRAYNAFLPFVKPGSDLDKEIRKTLQSLGPAPKATTKPKH